MCLLLVSVVLYVFRKIYGEAISAIPMNGGCYSVLLNTTTKPVSAWAASLGVLAYLATGIKFTEKICMITVYSGKNENIFMITTYSGGGFCDSHQRGALQRVVEHH